MIILRELAPSVVQLAKICFAFGFIHLRAEYSGPRPIAIPNKTTVKNRFEKNLCTNSFYNSLIVGNIAFQPSLFIPLHRRGIKNLTIPLVNPSSTIAFLQIVLQFYFDSPYVLGTLQHQYRINDRVDGGVEIVVLLPVTAQPLQLRYGEYYSISCNRQGVRDAKEARRI